ncbi:MAG: L-aspartate oxidase [Actinomycetales bacterium]|nr:L-aspartate oxidase [Actinomycetales bacterium]
MRSFPIARRLLAPPPGWTITADVIVVGSGVAGLSAALHARRSGHRVCVVTKAEINEGSTRWAQGGIAAALDPSDSPAEHWRDTIAAGGGVCDPEAVFTLVSEGPAAVLRLIRLGAHFDHDDDGQLSLTREGGHHKHRIAHAGGDATGAEVSRTLVEAVRHDEGIEIIEHALVLDLLLDDTGAAQGVTLHVMGEGLIDGVGAVLAPAVVLATGGIGQVYAQSTNPAVATGDGVAAALRAGAQVADMEFVQFHPTVLWTGPTSSGQQPLISEAVRGEGAVLRDDSGRAFMADVHPMADLAPRDVVSQAIVAAMRRTGAAHVWLDARAFGEEFWQQRFPTILQSCRSHGIDPVTQLIPVAPAQHFHSGGVRTDLSGRTSIPGLFACGECACTGVHGANRLASNSLLEGLVLAERIGRILRERLPERRAVGTATDGAAVVSNSQRTALQQLMTEQVAVVRDGDGLTQVPAALAAIASHAGAPSTEDWEMTNLLHVSAAIAHSAWLRQESRGSHVRTDFPQRDDTHWRARLALRREPAGHLSHEIVPVPPATLEALT